MLGLAFHLQNLFTQTFTTGVIVFKLESHSIPSEGGQGFSLLSVNVSKMSYCHEVIWFMGYDRA